MPHQIKVCYNKHILQDNVNLISGIYIYRVYIKVLSKNANDDMFNLCKSRTCTISHNCSMFKRIRNKGEKAGKEKKFD